MLFKNSHQNNLKRLPSYFLSKIHFMKRNFYPFLIFSKVLPALLLVFMLLSGITAKVQITYTITFPFGPPPPTTNPNMDRNDGPGFGPQLEQTIETGVRFRVTVPGNVVAIRFYKGLGQGNVHIGHLWNNNGSTMLAEELFIETPDGWQDVLLATPVHITPADTFVVSVWSDVGDYAADPLGASNWYGTPGNDIGTGPILVIAYDNANEPDGYTGNNNGVYDYLFNPPNNTGAFPTSGNGVNFYVDLRFQPDSPLPVTLSGFRAITSNNDVLLNWKTETEFNNKGFEIQRSNNGTDWYAVNFLNGAGESASARNYSYTDKGLAPGLYYYRLKQLDNDGLFKNSPVVTATVSGKGRIVLFQNSPNPFRSTATIRFDLPTAQKVRLSILDILGREVKVLTNKQSEAGSHLIPVDVTGLNRQLYYIRLQTESGTLTRNMLVE
jgi:Domain of unknown function (DUF4082)/Secretion system C-terminal sorting domain